LSCFSHLNTESGTVADYEITSPAKPRNERLL
jgi:hypothetical protein